MLILGIDPGTATTGYGLIDVDTSKTNGDSLMVLEWGLIETDKSGTTAKRLENIHREMDEILRKFSPDTLAIEKIFFAANAKTAIAVGQAQGVMFLAASKNNVEIVEYAPMSIKKMVAGDGRADKKVMQQAVRKYLGAKVRSKAHGKTHFDNAADALAVALCHVFKMKEGDYVG